MAGATGVPFAPGNRLDILNNGDAFYPAMLEAIRSAELSITIEAYIYWAGEIGQRVRRGAGRKEQRKASRSRSCSTRSDPPPSATDILKTLESGHCQLAWYNPFAVVLARTLQPPHPSQVAHPRRPDRVHRRRRHCRPLAGKREDPGHWRDMQIRLEGPAVTPLQTGFAQNWLQTTGELISGPLFYPPHSKPAGPLAVQTIMSSPEIGASTVRTMYYLSIICARKSIYIANPYFVPDEAAIDALVEAKNRGVDVRIMVSGIHNDNWLARQNSVRLFGPLLEAGIEILEYNRTMLHHKTMVVDAVWATIGTTNFDNRSFAHNEENNVCFFDADIACAMHETFLADAEMCERLTLEGWRRRGVLRRGGEIVAAFLQEQI